MLNPVISKFREAQQDLDFGLTQKDYNIFYLTHQTGLHHFGLPETPYVGL